MRRSSESSPKMLFWRGAKGSPMTHDKVSDTTRTSDLIRSAIQ